MPEKCVGELGGGGRGKRLRGTVANLRSGGVGRMWVGQEEEQLQIHWCGVVCG